MGQFSVTIYGATGSVLNDIQHEYTHGDGGVRTGETFGWGTKTQYITGDVVSIGYYPDDPSKVRVRNWFAGWRYQIVLFGLGLALIAYSIKAVAIIKQEDADATSSQET